MLKCYSCEWWKTLEVWTKIGTWTKGTTVMFSGYPLFPVNSVLISSLKCVSLPFVLLISCHSFDSFFANLKKSSPQDLSIDLNSFKLTHLLLAKHFFLSPKIHTFQDVQYFIFLKTFLIEYELPRLIVMMSIYLLTRQKLNKSGLNQTKFHGGHIYN